MHKTVCTGTTPGQLGVSIGWDLLVGERSHDDIASSAVVLTGNLNLPIAES